MIASRIEARYWSWIVLGIYAIAFCCWPLDRRDMAGFLTKLFPATAMGTGLGYLIAAALAGVGAALMTWTSAYSANGDSRAGTLITGGPYGHIRNPQFLSIWLCCFAFGLLLNGLGLVIVAVSTAVQFYRLIRREEIQLAVAHGSSYEKYCATVPSLAPTLSHTSMQPIVKPSWIRGVATSAHLWLAAAALVALALTLRESVFLEILGVAALVRLALGLIPRTSRS